MLGAGDSAVERSQEFKQKIYDHVMKKNSGSVISPIVAETIRKGVEKDGEQWDPILTAKAFLYLEEYSKSLSLNPWKPEFRNIKVIKLPCSFNFHQFCFQIYRCY